MISHRHPPGSPDGFTSAEEREIGDGVRAKREVRCPRCRTPLDEWAVGPRADVSYVRSRVWLVCPSCRRSVVVDRPQTDRS